jgi:glycosyltransferase involved in cell wall biosynthesis
MRGTKQQTTTAYCSPVDRQLKVGMQRAIVLGVHSFLDQRVKVGIQYIAEGLAQNGWEVDYISVPSSPFDLFGRERRKRLMRVWIGRQDIKGAVLSSHLTEYAFRTLHPVHKLFLRNQVLLDNYSRMAPVWLRTRRYDICIHDVTVNILFLPLIRAGLRVLRLNDPPDGFSFHIHKRLIDRFEERIGSLSYDEIWAVSKPLSEYVQQLNPANNVVVLPNGIENRFLSFICDGERRPKTAVYLGSISPWVDLELLEQTALLLPDWQFHVYGPCNVPWTVRSKNILRLGPIAREVVPTLLAEYEVGLIPFRDICDRMKFVERPLKFYEYIGAGLGIASTKVGALQKGMEGFAFFGQSPREFSQAIVQAAKNSSKRTVAFNRAFIKDHAWRNIILKMCRRISMLQTQHTSSID